MRTQPRISIVLLLLALLPFSARCFARSLATNSGQPSTSFETSVRVPLSRASNGVDGYLELRQDVRLSPKLRAILWRTGDANLDDDPSLAPIKADPLRNGSIRVVDRAGKVLEVKKLERPLAKLRTEHLYGDAKLTYLLTVDYSADFGSYSGPITSLIEVESGHIQWVTFTDVKSSQTEEISLMDSLKTTWKLVSAPGGRGKQILEAQCRPDWSSVKNDPEFTTTYARFYFNGTKWLKKERTTKGISEFDQGFPSRKNFP